MRITVGVVAGQYLENLSTSLNNFNVASRRATAYRSFERISKNPFTTMKLYRFRQEMTEDGTYQDSLGDVDSQLMTTQSAMQSIYSIVSNAKSGDVIQTIAGTMSESDRTITANRVRRMQQTFLSPSDTKFGEKYLFGGAETTEVPFSVNDSGELLYRGVNVSTGKIETGLAVNFNEALIEFNSSSSDPVTDPDTGYTVKDGIVLKITDGGADSETNISISDDYITVKADLSKYKVDQDLLNLVKGHDKIDFSKIRTSDDMSCSIPVSDGAGGYQETVSAPLAGSIDQGEFSALANEEALVNLGLGLKTTAGANSTTVSSQSALNSAIPGISFLGYGQDSSRISDDLYALVGQITDQLEDDDFSTENTQPYLDRFGEESDVLLGEIMKSGSKSDFLSTMKANLESVGDSLLERAEDIRYVDPGDAIMSFYMQRCAYSATLSMGIKILNKSFISFMA